MLYPDSVEFLYSLGNEIKSVKFGLESVRSVLDALGNPQDAPRIVHVAGTNGKGSTCAMIESALRLHGYRTALYTSPHLVEPTERICIAGVPVTREAFADAFRQVHECNEHLIAAGQLEHHTTYFETVTAMGFLLMRSANVEVAVVEVGLGGRLDATNVVHPALTVITPVDFDHEQFLGNSLDSIAFEKAGILKPGVPAIFAAQRPEAQSVLDHRAAELGVEVIRTSEYDVTKLTVSPRGSEFLTKRTQPMHIRCPLAGAHQVENALAAVAALEQLQIPAEAIESGIAATRWPGRLEVIGQNPEILLDGAHNPAGARALAAHLRQFYAGRRLRLFYGAMRDKSVQEITEILFPLADEVILTTLTSPRAVRPDALLRTSDHRNMSVAESAADALALARATDPDDVAVITGSLYLVGEIESLLQ